MHVHRRLLHQWLQHRLLHHRLLHQRRSSSSASAPAPIIIFTLAAKVKDRCCFKCEKYHATGTCDFLQRNRWYCVDCGLNALDMYEDKELAEAIRFLRSHACKSQHEVYSHNSFLGFGDPTCYNGRNCFSAEDVQLVQRYSKIVEFFYQRKV